jgi:hypothetical protein
LRSHWRRFLPRRRPKIEVPTIAGYPRTVRSVEDANRLIDEMRGLGTPATKLEQQANYRQLVILQTPRAALAQIQMDTHKHGYHNREKRLYELIEFNDTFVNFVLATPHVQLPGLAEQLKKDMSDFCRMLQTPMFSDEQYDAIVRGLSREIAVYRTARYHKFDVRMTSRADDAFGIDMIITQPETGKVLNIDCKTPAAFRHRLEDLVHHGRIDEADLLKGDRQGFLTITHRRGDEHVPVTLFCILPDRLGEISDFTFDEPGRLKGMLDTMFQSV